MVIDTGYPHLVLQLLLVHLSAVMHTTQQLQKCRQCPGQHLWGRREGRGRVTEAKCMLRGWRDREPGFGDIKVYDNCFSKSVAVDHFNNCPILLQHEISNRNHVDLISDLSCSSETHEVSHPYSNCPPSKQHH